jgi:hypothetical protein
MAGVPRSAFSYYLTKDFPASHPMKTVSAAGRSLYKAMYAVEITAKKKFLASRLSLGDS